MRVGPTIELTVMGHLAAFGGYLVTAVVIIARHEPKEGKPRDPGNRGGIITRDSQINALLEKSHSRLERCPRSANLQRPHPAHSRRSRLAWRAAAVTGLSREQFRARIKMISGATPSTDSRWL